MRIIQNERRIRVRRAVGQYVPWVALLILGTGLVLSYIRPSWLLALVAAVILGVILSVIGGRFAERYAGPLAHHETLPAALKGLDSQHLLAQYVLPAPHVLLDPGGVTVLVVKSHAGQITFEEGRFKNRQKGRIFRQLAGQESLALVHREAAALATRVESWLRTNAGGLDVPVRAGIVFINPSAKVDASDSPVPAFYGKKVKSWLRGPGKRKTLPSSTYQAAVRAFEALGSEAEG
jgi:hypothetical protein